MCQIQLYTLGGFRTPTLWGWRVEEEEEEEEERVSYKSQLILLPAWRSKDRRGSPFALFLFGHALFEKERRKGFPFPGVAKKSLSSFLFFLFSVWGSLFLPPQKKKNKYPTGFSVGSSICPYLPMQFESFSPPKANSCRNPSQPEKEEPSKQSTSFCPFFSPLFFLYVLSLYGSSIV